MSKDLIPRQALLDAVYKSQKENPHSLPRDRAMHEHEHKHFLVMIHAAPSIEAAPVVHGRWVYNGDDFIPYCNQCQFPQDAPKNFCPNCGAKMDLEG